MDDKIKCFTEDSKILTILDELNKNEYKNKHYSDITDAEGNQYVDLVLEGGGVLGIALVGYIYILEKMKIRFMGIGGTSVGSILTLLLGCGKMNEAKSEWILEKISGMDFKKFLDFHDEDKDSDLLIDLMDKKISKFEKYIKLLKLIDNFYKAKKEIGLLKGDAFKEWLKKIINEKGIKTLEDLIVGRSIKPEGLKKREEAESREEFVFDEKCRKIAIIATDITTESKIEFPRMAKLYWKESEKVNPVEFVRASMSIPVVFSPYVIENIKHESNLWRKWMEETNYRGNLPEKVYFVDGGIISNFPINIFHKASGIPRRPTFGVLLGDDRDEINEINSLQKLLLATFSSARHSLDNEYIMNNPDYNQVVTYINTKNYNWLNFRMDEKEKLELFLEGAKAAGEFLKRFDWKGYKKTRIELASAVNTVTQSKSEPLKPSTQ